MERIYRATSVLGLSHRSARSGQWRYILIVLVALTELALPARSLGASLTTASVALSDSRPSQTSVNYTVTVSGVTATALRCITATFVTTPTGSTAVPSLVASSATVNAGSTLLTSSTGSWSTTDTANQVKYTNTTNATAPTVTTGATFAMQAIQNGSITDTNYWVQFATFSDSGCTAPLDNTTVGFIYTNGSNVSLTVDQTLSFSVAGVASSQSCDGATTTQTSTATTIPFGAVTPASNGVVCQDLSAATNASNGYTISARYTGAPDNGVGDLLADFTGSNASPATFSGAGTEAYGYTTDDATLGTGTAGRFTSGGQKWAAMTTASSEVAYESAGVTSTTYRIGHQVGIATTTISGNYQTTIIYTCTPIY